MNSPSNISVKAASNTLSETDMSARLNPPAKIREFGAVNWMGLWTLYKKEVRRFAKIMPQTLLAPMTSNLLYMIIFVFAFSANRTGAAAGAAGAGMDDFVAFLAPGLIMLGILNNASANSSSSILQGKMMGAINDVLMPPLSSTEIALGYIGGAMTRGIAVGLFTGVGLAIFVPILNLSESAPLIITHPWAIIFYGLAASLIMGMFGVLVGLWAQKFDQMAVVNNFIIMPLSFLSGTFYKISVLPQTFQNISFANPMFYMIDGFRYGFTGEHEGNLMIGAVFLLSLIIILFTAVLMVLKSGWRLKA